MTLKNFFKPEFGKWFQKLPSHIREKAFKAFKHVEKQNQSTFPRGLEFKQIRCTLYSIRIDANYRALGHKVGDTIHWEWIGTHDEYMRRIRG